MCGRYTLSQPEAIIEDLEVEVLGSIEARYNIAPTQEAPIVRPRKDTGAWAVASVRWGLVPFWADDLSIGNRLINARSETAASKPAFSQSFAERRCLVLADGFYEWQKVEGGKQPFHVRRPDGGGLLFAGLWARWRKGEKPLDSFTILTTRANARIAALHDRMPVILDRAAAARWLDRAEADLGALEALMVPAPDDLLEAVPVGRRVGNPRFDDPELMQPIVLDQAQDQS